MLNREDKVLVFTQRRERGSKTIGKGLSSPACSAHSDKVCRSRNSESGALRTKTARASPQGRNVRHSASRASRSAPAIGESSIQPRGHE